MTFVTRQTSVDIGLICPMHFHSEFEFLYVNSGIMKYCADNTEYIAHKGDIMFINSNVPHCTEALTNGCSHSFIQFNEHRVENDSIKYLSKFLKLSDTPAYLFAKNDDDTTKLGGYIDEIINNYDCEEIHYDYYINGMMHLILALLYRRKILTSKMR